MSKKRSEYRKIIRMRIFKKRMRRFRKNRVLIIEFEQGDPKKKIRIQKNNKF